jgi:hypothetical protein
MDSATTIHIRLASDGNWPPVAFEEVKAFPVSGDRFRVASPPAFARRLAVGDIVRVARYGTPEQPWIEDLIEPGGHSTVRVIFFRSAGSGHEKDLRSKISQFGARVFETSLEGLVAIDVPADVDYGIVREYPAAREDRKLWEFEEGAISAIHDTGRLSPWSGDELRSCRPSWR